MKFLTAIFFLVTALSTATGQPLPQIRDEPPAWLGERDDPAADGWHSEVFNNAANGQLKRIAQWMKYGNPDFDWSGVAHAEFLAGNLRPDSLAVAYERGSIRVRRPVERSPGSENDEAPGPQALARALTALIEPLQGAQTPPQVKFKVVGVAPSSRGLIWTPVLFQASSRSPTGSLQLNAKFQFGWLPGNDSAAPVLRTIVVEDYEEVEFHGRGGAMFSDVTESALGAEPAFTEQLRFGNEYWMRRMQSVLGIDNYGHHGLAVGDVNGDELEDVYVCQTGGMPNRLLVQNSDGTARDVSAASGVDFMERTHAALLIDLDNDGDQDLVLATQASLSFLANDGAGNFEKVGEGAIASAYSLAAADYDADGDLDIYATAYVAPPEWERQGGLGLQPLPYHDANNGAANVLYRNDGEWAFTDVTEASGLDANNRRWTFAAAWADYDMDGDQDLYVANDFGRNSLYRNDDGRFVDVAADAGVEDSASGMSVSWGDYDGDGLLDLYVGNMFSAAGNRIVPQRGFQPRAAGTVKSEFRRFARGNTLFRNLGDGTFHDVSEAAGVTMGRWAWSSPFVDLDNDGFEDLVVGNGYLTNENSGDL